MSIKNLWPAGRKIIERSNSGVPLGSLTGATAILESAEPYDIGFYRLHPGAKALEIFKKRASKTKAQVIFCMSETEITLEGKIIICLKEMDFNQAIDQAQKAFYPQKKNQKIIGITGTNGKTSTCFLARQIAQEFGVQAYALGTLGLIGRDNHTVKDFEGSNTPSQIDFFRTLSECDDKAVIFFEFSSHALEQKRIGDLELFAAGISSFGQDHLDYHKTIGNYAAAKLKIFDYLRPGDFLFLAPTGRPLLSMMTPLQRERIKEVELINEKSFKDFPLSCRPSFCHSNLSLAFSLAELGCGLSRRVDQQLTLPPGRMTCLNGPRNELVIIDYAHSADSLEELCQSVRAAWKDRKLTLVFGCGGDRDKSKRPLMGEIAKKFGNKVILTSDNPRTEVPRDIIADIEKGLGESDYRIEVDRESAIYEALLNAGEGDLIVIAGKGHESYQEVNGQKIPFLDEDVVRKFWEKV